MAEPCRLHVDVTVLLSTPTVEVLEDSGGEPFVLLSADWPSPTVTLTTIAGLPALECAAAWRVVRDAADRVVREFEQRAVDAVGNG